MALFQNVFRENGHSQIYVKYLTPGRYPVQKICPSKKRRQSGR